MMEMAVTDMVTALKNEGIDATTTWMGDKTGTTKEILVGKTANFSNKMLEGIDIERLGVNGFVITVHNYANEHGYKVFADYGAKYYISAVGKTVSVKTDVEWGNAEFIIDDSAVTPDKRGDWIFTIATDRREYDIDTVNSIDCNTTNIGVTLPQKSIVTFYDSTIKQYIRYGANADSGATKRDTVIVHADGTIDSAAPLMWDFDRITRTVVLPIDTVHIAVGGGHFITVANRAPIECSYYARGINVMRSNVCEAPALVGIHP